MGKWEPVAKYSFLTIASKIHGFTQVANRLLDKEEENDYRESMINEWNKRAKRSGRLAVLSCRYPSADLEFESRKHVLSITRFLGEDIVGTRILEIGCGIGLLSKYLVEVAEKLNCIDISSDMIEKNRNYLGSLASKVIYSNIFFQDFDIVAKFDISIVSLVLIHNTTRKAYEDFISKLRDSSNIIFLFEHLDVETQSSSYTKHRKLNEIIQDLGDFVLTKKDQRFLFTDKITFAKLERKETATNN